METLELSTNDGFIYVLQCRSLNCCKIGWSRTLAGIQERVKACSTFCPAEVELVASFPGAKDDETRLHKYFRRQRIRGEWFVWTDDVRRMVSESGVASGPDAPRQSWNPAKWIARGVTTKKLRLPMVSVNLKGRRHYLARFSHPITGKDLYFGTGESDKDRAMQKAIAWRDQWWADLKAQLVSSRESRRKVVL